MPITVLDNSDAATIQPNAAGVVVLGQYIPRPQPIIAPVPPPSFEEPPPSIGPPAGAIALPNPQIPQAAIWTAAMDLASLARWPDVQELSGRQ